MLCHLLPGPAVLLDGPLPLTGCHAGLYPSQLALLLRHLLLSYKAGFYCVHSQAAATQPAEVVALPDKLIPPSKARDAAPLPCEEQAASASSAAAADAQVRWGSSCPVGKPYICYVNVRTYSRKTPMCRILLALTCAAILLLCMIIWLHAVWASAQNSKESHQQEEACQRLFQGVYRC